MKTRKDFRVLFPKLQSRNLLILTLCSVTGAVVGGSLTALAVMRVASNLPHDGEALLASLPAVLGFQVVVGVALTIPAFLMIGAVASMPLFGALHRVQQYLRDVDEGRESAALVLRTEDPLQELGTLASKVTEAQRAQNAERAQEQAAA
ncbi:MAG: hypothetical protein H6830_07035 [Planctomycetes bacterium]|nr:hypothetical protein [Planctomycetota bacterium]MCB9911062.1 hypothetical protein [Planctomycetota bacterium]MCB9911471.1 hypothetical protein [Planctomycetota bacterium]HPF13968.1 hypothetical protein [Planctomycetota bacterium]